jgi:RNA polymerase-interacting CarD/CdnL/TRCF family regulator
MYNIGDNIIYGMGGIMTVVDIRRESFTGEEKDYYILCDYGNCGSSVTYVPMDNLKLIESMHRLLTRDEATESISKAKELPDVEWIPDSRARTEAYREIMRRADRAEILAMIRTIHHTGLSRAAIGKKNFLADENVMLKAESILLVEFSIVLGISESEVRKIIDRDIKGIEEA